MVACYLPNVNRYVEYRDSGPDQEEFHFGTGFGVTPRALRKSLKSLRLKVTGKVQNRRANGSPFVVGIRLRGVRCGFSRYSMRVGNGQRSSRERKSKRSLFDSGFVSTNLRTQTRRLRHAAVRPVRDRRNREGCGTRPLRAINSEIGHPPNGNSVSFVASK